MADGGRPSAGPAGEASAGEDTTVRDRLARDRTAMANERTLLAYLRTAIMIFASGVTLLKLFPDEPVVAVSGWVLLPVGLGVAAWGYARFRKMRRDIDGSK